MAKLTLSDVSNLLGSPTSAAETINANSALIEAAIEKTLSRDGTTPNQMTADIDLNNNDLLNVRDLEATTLTLDGVIVIPTGLESLPDTIMSKTTYDPQEIEGDAFALGVHTGRVSSNANLPQVPNATIKGRATVGTGNSEDLTVDQTVEVLGLTYIKDLGSHSIALRKFRTTFVDPSDWTTVLQAAGDSGERAIRVHADAEVTASDQWSIDTDGQKWIGEAMDFKSQIRRTTVVNEPFILVRGERCSMRHLGIKCNSNAGMSTNNIGIKVARVAGSPADLDFEFRTGYLSGFFYGLQGLGRGITVTDNLISDVRYGVDLGWPAAGTFIKDEFVGDSDTNGFRRQVVSRNEFHSIEVAGVRNRGYNAANIALVMNGNTSNFGKGMFQGQLGDGSIIENNSITNANFLAYSIEGGRNWVMRNNIVASDPTVGGFDNPSGFIEISGANDGFIIDGFTGIGSTGTTSTSAARGGIDMRDGDFKGILRNIDLREVGTDSRATRDGVTIIGTGANTIVLASGVSLRSTIANRSIVRMDTAASVLKYHELVPMDAATPATSGAGTFTAV